MPTTFRTSHEGAKRHPMAANSHENAARHHREPAKHHENGDHEKAGHHDHAARGHASQAMQRGDEAAREHAETLAAMK